MTRACLVLLAMTVGPTMALDAQTTQSLDLGTVHSLVEAADARRSIADLEHEASRLRSENLGTMRLPNFRIRSEAGYQSEVIELPFDNTGFIVPTPPRDRYEVALDLDWTVWDGGATEARRQLEAAHLHRTMAELDSQIYESRRHATDAYFVVLVLQQQATEIDVFIEDITTRLSEVETLVEEGVALPGESATLRAELLTLQQRRDAILSERRVALETLTRLTERRLAPDVQLLLPDLTALVPRIGPSDTDVRSAIPGLGEVSSHPQFALFESQRRQADRQVDLIQAGSGPALSAFGQLGYGRPGFDPFNDSLHEYWMAGVRVVWSPWSWGRNERQVREARLQSQAIDAREEFFTDEMLRAVEAPLRTAEYMRSALTTDDEIIVLREEAAEYARARYAERAISAPAYSAAVTALQDARIARLQHQVQLARAEAIVLLTLGIDIP